LQDDAIGRAIRCHIMIQEVLQRVTDYEGSPTTFNPRKRKGLYTAMIRPLILFVPLAVAATCWRTNWRS